MLARLLNILFPEQCPECGRSPDKYRTSPFCSRCWEGISPYEGPSCRICGRPFSSDAAIVCGECIKQTPPFITAQSFGLHKGVLRSAISHLKYHRRRTLARPLAGMLSGMDMPEADVIVPVPLFKKRLCQREYNQSALLALNLSKAKGIPLLMNRLFKVRETPTQVGLGSAHRRRNLKGAFSVKNPDGIMDRTVILIDDVITTGATAAECAAELRRAGAAGVHVLALAHGVTD